MYESTFVPEVELYKINHSSIPIGLWAGTEDELSDLEDVQWLNEKISKRVVHYDEVEAGQASFMVGLDMSYLEDLVDILGKYNPVPDYIKQKEEEVDLIEIVEKYEEAADK